MCGIKWNTLTHILITATGAGKYKGIIWIIIYDSIPHTGYFSDFFRKDFHSFKYPHIIRLDRFHFVQKGSVYFIQNTFKPQPVNDLMKNRLIIVCIKNILCWK